MSRVIENGLAPNPLTLCCVPVLVHVQVWVRIPGDPLSAQLRNNNNSNCKKEKKNLPSSTLQVIKLCCPVSSTPLAFLTQTALGSTPTSVNVPKLLLSAESPVHLEMWCTARFSCPLCSLYRMSPWWSLCKLYSSI